MAEETKTNGAQTKSSASKTTESKTTTSRSRASTKATEAAEEQALALSVPKSLLPQNRPIQPSNLEIVHTYSSVGSDRPVSKGTVNFSSSLVISGNRPIAASTLQVSDSYIMGNRPVASNESDETATLMGYID